MLFRNKLNNLFQHHRGLCGPRDSLSLFVEYCGEGQVKIHRQFYVHQQFTSFFIDENNNYSFLDLRDVIDVVPFNLFRELLFKLYNRRHKSYVEFEFINEIFQIADAPIRYHDDIGENESAIEEFLDRINNVFCRYYYSIADNVIYSDDAVYRKINLLEEIDDYNPNVHYEDYIDKPEIESAKGKEDLYELRVFDVGQANCSALIKYLDETKNDYKVIMVFDLGYQKRGNRKNVKLDEMINKVDENTTILISHFDNDHINNITNHLKIATNRWIFPAYNGNKKRALKAYQALLCVAKGKTRSRRVHNFPTPFAFSKNISIHQYLETTKGDKFQSTLINSQCLVCKLSINECDVLIPADALYDELGNELILGKNKKYDYVLIPHHCCKYGDPLSIPKGHMIWNIIGDNTTGIVMCGNNKHGHANVSHLSWYKKIQLFDGSSLFKDDKSVVSVIRKAKSDYYPIVFK